LERYRVEECNGRGIKVRKVTKNLINCREQQATNLGGKMDCADFKQSYLELRVTKLGPGGLDGNMEERRIGWDNKCWND
jgi:hypothetical protein